MRSARRLSPATRKLIAELILTPPAVDVWVRRQGDAAAGVCVRIVQLTRFVPTVRKLTLLLASQRSPGDDDADGDANSGRGRSMKLTMASIQAGMAFSM